MITQSHLNNGSATRIKSSISYDQPFCQEIRETSAPVQNDDRRTAKENQRRNSIRFTGLEKC